MMTLISNLKNIFGLKSFNQKCQRFNPFNPEFTIVIFIHYKSKIAAAIRGFKIVV